MRLPNSIQGAEDRGLDLSFATAGPWWKGQREPPSGVPKQRLLNGHLPQPPAAAPPPHLQESQRWLEGWSSSTAQLPTRPPVLVRARVVDPTPTRTRLAAPAVAPPGIKVLLERVQWPLEKVGQEQKLPACPPLGSFLWSPQPPPHMGKGGEAALCPQGPFGLEGDRLLLGNMATHEEGNAKPQKPPAAPHGNI